MKPQAPKRLTLSAALSSAVAAVLFGTVAQSVQAAALDGMTVPISGAANTGGLFGQVYNFQPAQVAGAESAISTTAQANPNFTAGGFPILSSVLNQLAPNNSGYSNVNFNNGSFGNNAPFSAYGSSTSDNLTVRWSGYINLPAGITTFATNSDDGSVIYIDGVRVVNNNQYQGSTRRIGQTQSFASPGAHEIVIAYYEGTGGAGMEARYAPGVNTTNAADAAFTIIPVLDAANGNAQVLTGVQNTAYTPADPTLAFTSAGTTGTVDFTNALQVNMTTLTFAGGNTLNYEGAASRFTGTTFNGGGTNILAVGTGSAFNQDIALGQLNDNGLATRLQKTGPGQLVLDQTASANAMSSGSVLEIRGGGLVLAGAAGGQNPIGNAAIELGATLPSPAPTGVTVLPSTLSLTSKSGIAVFDNAVSVLASNTIIAQQLGGTANTTLLPGTAVGVPTAPTTANAVTVTLGSAANAVSVASGQTVTFQTNNGYTLELAGGVTGGGNVTFAPGFYTLSRQITNTGTLSVSTAAPTVFNYNVNNALNNRPLAVGSTASQVNIGSTVTDLGGDTFVIPTGNVIAVPSPAVGALLTRGVNLTAGAGAVIAGTTAGAANAVQGLGTGSEYFFGLAGTLTDNVTVGSVPGSTPWRGISTDRAARTMSGGTITALSNFQLSTPNNVSLTTQAINVVTPNGPVAVSVNMGGARWLPSSSTAGLNSNLTFTLNSGTIQLASASSLGSSANANANARIVGYSGTTLDPNGTANTMSGNIFLRTGAILQLNDANNLGGIGSLTGESGAVVQLQNATALGNASAAQTPATLAAGTVYRLEADLGASLATHTNPAGNYQVQVANRTNTLTLNAGTPTRSGFVSGLLSNDGGSRTLSGAVTIGANGGTLASTASFTFTINAPITVSSGGGRVLTVGTTRIVDAPTNGDIRSGIVSLGSASNNWGAGADALAQLNLVGRATLQNGTTTAVTALPQGAGLAVNLGGVYQINGGTGAGITNVQLGQVTPQGGTIALVRNATTPDSIVVNLNAPLARSSTFGPGARGSIVFQTTVGQTLGTNEKVVFTNASDAPARINGASGAINMVAPWMIGTDTTANTAIATFLDVDPATATTTGFKPVTYVAMPTTGGTGNEIADNTATTALTGPITVAALRTSAAITGQSINLSTGAILMRGAGAAVTISSGINFGANEGTIANISGQQYTLSGLLSGTGGLTKNGLNSIALSNAGSTLTGGITINEANLRPGATNGIPQNNVVTVNAAGVLELNGFDQTIQGLQGNGLVRNDATGSRTLTLNTATGTQFEFSGTIRTAAQAVALTKTGPGTQILSGTLGYTGNTAVNGGTLVVDGVSTAASNYTVANGATLRGLGLITGSVTGNSGSVIAPGGVSAALSVGQLRTGNLNLTSGANLALDLSGTSVGTGLGSTTGYDQVDVTGTVALTGANLQLALNYVPTFGDKLFLINNDAIDAITGTFASLNGVATPLGEGAVFSLLSSANSQSYDFQISYTGEFYGNNVNVGNDVVLVAVPEPTTGAFLLGAAVLGLVTRRRKVAAR